MDKTDEVMEMMDRAERVLTLDVEGRDEAPLYFRELRNALVLLEMTRLVVTCYEAHGGFVPDEVGQRHLDARRRVRDVIFNGKRPEEQRIARRVIAAFDKAAYESRP